MSESNVSYLEILRRLPPIKPPIGSGFSFGKATLLILADLALRRHAGNKRVIEHESFAIDLTKRVLALALSDGLSYEDAADLAYTAYFNAWIDLKSHRLLQLSNRDLIEELKAADAPFLGLHTASLLPDIRGRFQWL